MSWNLLNQRRSACACAVVTTLAVATVGCSSSQSQNPAPAAAEMAKPAKVPFTTTSPIVPTTLFDVPLKGRSRAGLLAALLQRGLVFRETSPGKFEGPAGKLLDGAKTLWLQFDGDEFVVGDYDFPSEMDAEQVMRVGKLVAAKYGKPDAQKGDPQVGVTSVLAQIVPI